MIDAQPVQADIDTFDDPPGRKVEVGQVIPPQLGADQVAVSRHVPQSNPQQHLGHAAPVKGRGVDEIHARVQSHAHGTNRFVQSDGPEFLAERRRSEAEHRDFKAGFSQFSVFHCQVQVLTGLTNLRLIMFNQLDPRESPPLKNCLKLARVCRAASSELG